MLTESNTIKVPMSERLKPFPTEYSAEISPEWEWMAKRFIRQGLKMLTQEIVVEGRNNIPEDISQSPYIVAVNHLGWGEAVVLLDTFPIWIHWMTKSENFDSKLLGPLFRILGFFPVRRGQVDRKALETASSLLNKGRILGMAPEGTRGRGDEFGHLKKAKHGTILIANKADIPIIPTAVWGTEELLPLIEEGIEPEDILQFKRPLVFVKIGEMFNQHRNVELDKRKLEVLTTNLMLEIRDMLPPEYHGYYAGAKRQSI